MLDFVKDYQRCTILLAVISVTTFVWQPAALASYKEKTAEQYRLEGYQEQQRGNLKQALAFYAKAIYLGIDDNAILFNDIGILYEKAHFQKRAEEAYRRAIGLNPGYLPPYMNLAYLYKNSGDTQRAFKYFKRRYELGQSDDPWTEKAEVELLAIRPEYRSWINHRKAEQLNEELVKRAQAAFYFQLERSSEHYNLGKKLVKKGKYHEAIKAYNDALDLTPRNPKILQARSDAIMRQARYDRQRKTVR